MKYLLDTNICIYIIKKNPISVLEKFTSLHIGDIGISSITLAELEFGVQKSHHIERNQAALEEFIFSLEILPFDTEATKNYGIIRNYLEKKGHPIGAMDLLIAAHAQALNVTLVTNNKKEFNRIPNLIIEDWVHHH